MFVKAIGYASTVGGGYDNGAEGVARPLQLLLATAAAATAAPSTTVTTTAATTTTTTTTTI